MTPSAGDQQLSEDGKDLAGDMRCSPSEQRGKELKFTFDGHPLLAYEGETVAAALLAIAQIVLRTTDRLEKPRSLFCNMGVCFDCLVQIDGHPNQRACRTLVAEGMRVESQVGVGSWESSS